MGSSSRYSYIHTFVLFSTCVYGEANAHVFYSLFYVCTYNAHFYKTRVNEKPSASSCNKKYDKGQKLFLSSYCHLIAILIVIVIAHAMLERNVFQTTGAMLGSNII